MTRDIDHRDREAKEWSHRASFAVDTGVTGDEKGPSQYRLGDDRLAFHPERVVICTTPRRSRAVSGIAYWSRVSSRRKNDSVVRTAVSVSYGQCREIPTHDNHSLNMIYRSIFRPYCLLQSPHIPESLTRADIHHIYYGSKSERREQARCHRNHPFTNTA